MTRNISDPQMIAGSLIPIVGEFKADVYRAQPDGTYRCEPGRWKRNQLTAAGLNRIANRAMNATGTTPFYVLGVGTVTAAASLDSTNFGEVSRKAATTAAQSREWMYCVGTWGGFADSVTSLALDSAAILCHASSGIGAVANIVNGLSVVLANSDFLALTARIRVGSHDLSHTT